MDKRTKKKSDSEFSSELACEPLVRRTKTEERPKTLGWIALIIAIASLFYWPGVLGPAAAVLGFIAYIRGSRALGAWSVTIGLIALLAFLFLVPYYS